MIKRFTLILLITFTCFGEDKAVQGQTIDDGDKTSARINDLITDVDMAKNGIDAVNLAKEAVNMKKNLKNINLKQKALDFALSQVVVYKTSRQHFVAVMKSVTDKASKVMDKASDRVNMWRTTEPMIQGFGETIHNLADNSVKVFQEFEPKDLLDIDRKWDRKMEGQMKANKQFIVGTIAFLNYEMALRSGNSFASLFLGDGMKEAMTKTPLGTRAFIAQMAVPVHSYRTIPAAALQRASEAIATCGLVCAQAHSTSKQDPSMSQEQADFQKIENSLTNPAQTYEDAREMGAMIDMKRQEIATQTTQLQQTYALLQADIARMILNEQENYAKQSEDMSLSLKAISKGETLGTLEEQMKKVEAQ